MDAWETGNGIAGTRATIQRSATCESRSEEF